MNNYQYGGWYDNPATGRNQRWFNGTWTDGAEPSSAGNPLDAYNSTVKEMNDSLSNYINQQSGFYQTQHDAEANLLNNQNTQALGTQDQNAQKSFLDSVLNPLQAKQGSIQYGYGLNQNHENATYGLNSTANAQNRDLALAKLANDENWANQSLNLAQGNKNASTIDTLNSRGLLYGQQPTGAYQGQAMSGMNGLAGQQAGLVNTDFANQRGLLTSDYGLNQQGANLAFTQQQNTLNENHGFNTNENAMNAATGVQNQNNQFGYQTTENNNQLAMYKAQLAQQQAQSQFQNKLSAQKLQGSNFS